MRAVIGAVAILMLAGLVTGQEKKDEKIDGKKLIGKWEPADAPKDASIVVEFADKGKLTFNISFLGKSEKVEGTYKLDGDKLSITMSFAGKEETKTATISKLTDDELTTKDDKGKEEKLKRVKAK